ncbi:MAG: hypothetical protein JO247_14430 [Chloroflexi bacterium]|nr:hypothetical protein [Chloroflexota bacterium]
MSHTEANQGLDIRCRADGCDREAAVYHKGTPLCIPHYHDRVGSVVQREPVRTQAGELEPGFNRHI